MVEELEEFRSLSRRARSRIRPRSLTAECLQRFELKAETLVTGQDPRVPEQVAHASDRTKTPLIAD